MCIRDRVNGVQLSPLEFLGEILDARARTTITANIPAGFTTATQYTMPDNSLRFKIDNGNATLGDTQFVWRTGSLTGTTIYTKTFI